MKNMFALRPIVTILMLSMLPLAASARIVETSRTIDVINNKGGNVIEMVGTRHKLERSGKQVRIRGYCRSACTMLITMPNACLGGKATVGFHAPRIPNTKIIPPYVSDVMARYYRNGILRKWNTEWRNSLEMHKISAREYVRLDPQTRLCGPDPGEF